ncbi:hypothetical protein BC332_34077 [Capsicum chinense]|nr:hypothetical protein BC332_34077 [Capsicum chinense]
MAGGIEEPFRLSFQERRSSFTHNRYLEEVEKYFKTGSVTEKKTYFEELFRRRALLSQSSSDCQDGVDSQSSNDGSENTDYEGDFEHVNEIGHSACFVENHDRAATLLENGKYQASENEGYAGNFEHVNEVGHSACFDKNYDSSTHLSKNGKYQAENAGYDGDFERVNEVGDSARFEKSFDGSNNGDIEVTKFGGEGSSNRDIEVTECGGEDSISCHSRPQTKQDTNSFDVLQSVPERLEAEAKFNLSAGNSTFNDLEVSSGSKANVLNQHKSSEKQPIARKVVASRASCTEKVSHRLYQSVNRKIKKQRSNSYGEISISKQPPCLPSTVNLTTAKKKPRYACYATYFLRALCCFNLVGLGDKVYTDNRCSTNERLNMADSPQVSEVTIHPLVELSDSSVPSAATSKMSKQTQSNRTVAPKREQEKRQVANSPRPRTSDSIRRNKDFKAKDKTKVLARRTGNHAMRKDVEVWT